MIYQHNQAASSSHALRNVARWAAVFVWAAFIFYMSARTGSQLNTGLYGAVKEAVDQLASGAVGHKVDASSTIAHFLEYAVLGVLLANALREHVGLGIACAMAVVLASMYGITDEIHQAFVPKRYVDAFDWMVDTGGASLGALLYWLGMRRR